MYYDKIIEFLAQTGLARNEARIYVALLGNGASSISEISKKSGVYRTLAYQTVDKLIEKGLVNEKIIGAKRLFEAAKPEKLKSIAIEKEKKARNNIENAMELLEKITPTTGKPGIKTYFGIEGLKSALIEEIRTTKESGAILVFHAIPEIPKLAPFFTSEYHQKRIEKKITAMAIYDSRPESVKRAKQLAKMKFSNIRILPENYQSLISYHIFEDNLLIISMIRDDVVCVLIENRRIAEGFKENFFSIWKKSKKIENFKA